MNPLGDWNTQAEDPAAIAHKMRCGPRHEKFAFLYFLHKKVAGANPMAEEGEELMEKAAGQGHSHVMLLLGARSTCKPVIGSIQVETSMVRSR